MPVFDIKYGDGLFKQVEASRYESHGEWIKFWEDTKLVYQIKAASVQSVEEQAVNLITLLDRIKALENRPVRNGPDYYEFNNLESKLRNLESRSYLRKDYKGQWDVIELYANGTTLTPLREAVKK